jgi:signal transduction histidine kinase
VRLLAIGVFCPRAVWRFAARRSSSIGAADAAPSLVVRGWIESRIVVLGAAVGSFATIFALRQSSGDAADTISLLYVIPISLVALELGLTAGVVAAAFALVLVDVSALTPHAALGALGVGTRGAAYLAVGAVTGRFSDRMRDIQRRQSLLLESGLGLVNLTHAEDLSAMLARDAHTLVNAFGARVELIGRAPVESGVLEGPAERVPIQARGIRYGTLDVAASHPISPEDRVMLGILTLQAALSAENQRLLDDVRERAMLRGELQDARSHLAERGDQLRELMASHEAERHHVADELHEQAAQTLAGVLLGLRAIERELESDLAAPKLGALRSNVDSTLRTLRSLAVSLRPPVLQLGLKAALDALAAETSDQGSTEITVALEGISDLSPDAETILYRIVEEALDAAGGAGSITVTAEPASGELVIALDGGKHPIPHERLAILSARLELLHGTLTATTNKLRAVIRL